MALEIPMESEHPAEHYLFNRAGYNYKGGVSILLMHLQTGEIQSDPGSWQYDGCMSTAHNYIIENFTDLEPGAVIDAEYLRGETQEPKQSERFLP
jgi:hypothetical protein